MTKILNLDIGWTDKDICIQRSDCQAIVCHVWNLLDLYGTCGNMR
eukprot:CAMPEP_0168262248 /NCGR_PEP_ID=MMETSP0141_2-20121125/9601_1 /TAXON_ID=44445 /ORGANISM="Pseudo-nitzschia australis, Strain 10249 10 AB" /LENGTH=44 /DNA_ID= /DNA_START= /DNA_END= /DNA_ORIENTATION=